MRYYLVGGYTLPLYSFGNDIDETIRIERRFAHIDDFSTFLKDLGIEHPRNFQIHRFSLHSSLHAVYHNLFRGSLLVKATGRREAYRVANAIEGLVWLLQDAPHLEDRSECLLTRVRHVPSQNWDFERLSRELAEPPFLASRLVGDAREFGSGLQVDPQTIRMTPYYGQLIYDSHPMNNALMYLRHSMRLERSVMNPSFYQFEYKPDREATDSYEIERHYLELRPHYETSFLSAFKAIEFLLGKQSFSRGEVAALVDRLVQGTALSSERYRRIYENLAGQKTWATYEEMIAHFLDIRNAAAAHGNPSPPNKALIAMDNIYEIQHFVLDLFWKIVNAGVSIPAGAGIRPATHLTYG